MDKSNSNSEEDPRQGQGPSKRSSSSEKDENDEPGSSSAATFHKLKEPVKKRSYRKKTSESEDSEVTFSEEPQLNTDTDLEAISDRDGEANSEQDSDNSNDWMTTEEECIDDIGTVLRKIKQKPTLSIINEITQRQIGHSRLFESKFYGSLHMVERLKFLHSFKEHKGCVNTIEFNAKGDLLVSGSDDLAVMVWNWATGKRQNSYKSGHVNNIFQATWLPRDELTVITCANDGQIRCLDLVTGNTVKLAAHEGSCNRFAIHPDYPHVAISVGDDGVIKSIDVRDGDTVELTTIKKGAFRTQLYSIHSNPRNANEFCVGGRFESVTIYDRRNASKALIKNLCPKNLQDNKSVHITCATYNYNGTEILASYNDNDIYLFDTLIPHPNGDYAHKYQGHRNFKTIKGVNFFGPKSEFIVSGSDCGNVYFWEKNSEAIVQCMPGDAQGVVNRVEPHPHIPVLAVSGLDDDIKIWVPSADEPPDLTEMKDFILDNLRRRGDRKFQLQKFYQGNLLWIAMTQFYFNCGLRGGRGSMERRRAHRHYLSIRRLYGDEDDEDDDADEDDDD